MHRVKVLFTLLLNRYSISSFYGTHLTCIISCKRLHNVASA